MLSVRAPDSAVFGLPEFQQCPAMQHISDHWSARTINRDRRFSATRSRCTWSWVLHHRWQFIFVWRTILNYVRRSFSAAQTSWRRSKQEIITITTWNYDRSRYQSGCYISFYEWFVHHDWYRAKYTIVRKQGMTPIIYNLVYYFYQRQTSAGNSTYIKIWITWT